MLTYCRNLFLAMVFLSGCSFQSGGEKSKNGSVNFALSEFVFHDSVETNKKSKSELIKNIVLSTKSCAKDPLASEPIIAKTFTISSGLGTESQVITDSEGCFVYEQAVTYNNLGSEKFVGISLNVKGSGVYEDNVSVRLAVNPWKNQILDRRYHQVEVAKYGTQKAQFLGMQQHNPAAIYPRGDKKSNLVIESVSLKGKYQKGNNDLETLSLDVKFSPSYEQQLNNGQFQRVSLNSDDLSVRVKFLDDEDFLIASSELYQVQNTNGFATGDDVILKLFGFVSSSRQTKVQIEVVPNESSAGLLPFFAEGFFHGNGLVAGEEVELVEIDEGTFSKSVVRDGNFDNVITVHKRNEDNGSAITISDWSVAKFGAAEVTDDQGVVMQPLLVRFCAYETLSKRPLTSVQFNADFVLESVGMGRGVSVTTDLEGCASFSKKVSYQLWAEEKYENYKINISPEFGNRNLQFVVLSPVNFWSPDETSMVWDYAHGSNPRQLNSEKPVITLDEIEFQLPSENSVYDVDQYMRLSRTKNIQFRMKPSVFRKQMLSGGNDSHNFKTELLLNTVVNVNYYFTAINSKDDQSQLRLISTYEGQVKVNENGELEDFVPFVYRFEELPVIQNGLRLFMSLDVDGSANKPQGAFVEIPLDLNIDSGKLLPSYRKMNSIDFQSLIERLVPNTHEMQTVSVDSLNQASENLWSKGVVKKPELVNSQSALDLFLARSDLPVATQKLLNRESIKQSFDFNFDVAKIFNQQEVELQSLSGEMRKLCRVFAPGNLKSSNAGSSNRIKTEDGQSKFCENSPLSYFFVDKMVFIGGKSKNAKLSRSQDRDFIMQAALWSGKVDRESEYVGTRGYKRVDGGVRTDIGVKGETGFKLFGNGVNGFASASGFGQISAGSETFTASETSAAFEKSQRMQFGDKVSLNVDHKTIEIQTDIELCYLVSGRKNPMRQCGSVSCKEFESKALLLCGEVKDYVFEENWFYMTDANPGQIGIAAENSLEGKFHMVLRGEERYKNVKREFIDATNNIALLKHDLGDFDQTEVLKADIKKFEYGVLEDSASGEFPGLISHTSFAYKSVVQSRSKMNPKKFGYPQWKISNEKFGETYQVVVSSYWKHAMKLKFFSSGEFVGEFPLDYKSGDSTTSVYEGKCPFFGSCFTFKRDLKRETCEAKYKKYVGGFVYEEVDLKMGHCSSKSLKFD